MDDCEKFNETSLPEEEEFYSNLSVEDIKNENLGDKNKTFR